MSVLNELEKKQIIHLLAAYNTPSEIVAEFKTNHDKELSIQQVCYYDPNNPASAKLADEWRAEFKRARDEFNASIHTIPIANQSFRINELMKMYRGTSPKAIKVRQSLMEQAAREVGGMYVNKSVVNVADPAEVDAAIERQLARVAGRGQAPIPGTPAEP